MKTHFISAPTRQTPLSVFAEHHYLERKRRGRPFDENGARETIEAVRDFLFSVGENPAIGEISPAMVAAWANTLGESKRRLASRLRDVLAYGVKRGIVGCRKRIGDAS